MHVRELVAVTGVVAQNGPVVLRTPAALPQAHVHQYWATSKGRFERWHVALRRLDRDGLARTGGPDLRGTLDEILAGEMLCRVWTAIVVGHDRRSARAADEPVARSVLSSHVEARQRALALLLDASRVERREAVVIDRLRRRVERWTDLLIGGLLPTADVREFAFDAQRAAEFAATLSERQSQPGGRQAWRLTLVSLDQAFRRLLSPFAANPDANARIAAAILGCFPEDVFDATGLPQSLWMVRLAATASDAQGLVDELVRRETAPRSRHAGPRRRLR